MNDTAFRILDALARNLGASFSIKGLAEEIAASKQPGYYKNIYDEVQRMNKEDLLNIAVNGAGSFVSLNFDSEGLLLALCEMEIRRTKALLEEPRWLALYKEMSWHFLKKPGYPPYPLEAACLIKDPTSLALNKADFLFIIETPLPFGPISLIPTQAEIMKRIEDEREAMYSYARFISERTNTQVSFLALTMEEFGDLASSPALNPLKDMIKAEVAIVNPQVYWLQFNKMRYEGKSILFQDTPADPLKLKRQDAAAVFSRFGYRELGAPESKTPGYCLETAIAAALLEQDARLLEAIPILLAKNHETISFPLLEYLAMKCGKLNLYGCLLALAQGASRSLKRNLRSEMSLFRVRKECHVEEKGQMLAKTWDLKLRINPNDVEQKMRDYSASR
ncbi:MAG: hypothetical protein V1708_01015 [Candidatus Micrarchaeota archaeon]